MIDPRVAELAEHDVASTAQKIIEGRVDPPYENWFIESIFARVEAAGKVVGRQAIVKCVHDGEVGRQYVVEPIAQVVDATSVEYYQDRANQPA